MQATNTTSAKTEGQKLHVISYLTMNINKISYMYLNLLKESDDFNSLAKKEKVAISTTWKIPKKKIQGVFRLEYKLKKKKKK